ncbi:DNA repair protein RAD4 isoform X3 [Lotus japonicus]|uniref:DNA repair protein RAD4 isoform X3 n=1 Tax=Lotus japonicus TaxID=34305 RepID=UPI00258EAC5C|nr:DNA repair protein RAD4 isoform X3 [Lotus japonicus]XP_057441964.1 DNA repair protein RAD4 isoform X3 [Lotus japonicus]
MFPVKLAGDETRSPHRPEETLTEISREAVGKLLRRANKVGSSKKKNKPEVEPEINGSQVSEQILQPQTSEVGHCGGNSIGNVSAEKKRNHVSLGQGFLDEKEELHDSDWEDGAVAMDDRPVTVELNVTPDSAVRKQIRRASAEDKELAELVHKAHLLCLLARGRLIDSACDDPLIQASLLSLLPAHLLQLSNVTELTSKALHPLIVWFHDNFHVKNCANEDKSPHFALASALESHEGSPEEIAALAVALFRALNLTARFVSILDVASIKPVASGSSKGIFSTSTPMISKLKLDFKSPKKSLSSNEREVVGESSLGRSLKSKKACTTSHMTRSKDPPVAKDLNQSVTNSPTSKAHDNNPESYAIDKSHKPKRKGDLEYEMQLEMALSATAVECSENKMESGVNAESSNVSCPSKRMKIIKGEESSTSPQVISTAVGSMKVGSPLYWAEIYCSQENLTGKWVHIDAVNMIIDGEDKVEAMVAACKTSLRYVVAFAGQGAKDVTRRYCMKWYKIAPQRVNSTWWDSVLAPLRDLESGATEGVVLSRTNQIVATEANMMDSSAPSRSSLEDIELETRALTEPLPTNQQAYKSHLLYAIEKWLTKYQVLHPKGPILGFCSGHPVYPRTCVQTVKTKERWLREGLQVKPNEHPVKVLKCSIKPQKVQDSEADDNGCSDSKENIKLYGKWQLEPLILPHAVNGIVPKNERGQVEVWSEKCLPPGTVHLRLPKAFYVAKRLEIDYAPAMVGFEFRNGRSYPVFDGIVVCAEFKDALLEAYAEEEERRQADEKRRDEAQALNRWYQLLSSIVTRQRLNNRYNSHLSSEMPSDVQCMNDNVSNATACGSSDENQNPRHHQVEKCDADFDASLSTPVKDHEHVFLKEYESFDKGTSLLTKRCQCGFSVQVEEL